METEKEKHTDSKKKGIKLYKNKNFPLGFSFGFFTMGMLTVILISLIIIPLTRKNEEVDTSLDIKGAETKIESFVNGILIQDDNKVTIKESSEESGLYKIIITTSAGQDIETYVTKDGRFFFDRAMNVE